MKIYCVGPKLHSGTDKPETNNQLSSVAQFYQLF